MIIGIETYKRQNTKSNSAKICQILPLHHENVKLFRQSFDGAI